MGAHLTALPPLHDSLSSHPTLSDLLNGKQTTKHHPKSLKPFHPETPLFGPKSYSLFSNQQRGIITITEESEEQMQTSSIT